MNRIDMAIRDAEGAVTRVMDKHTPGPWRVVGKGTGDDCIRGPKNRDGSSILVAVMGDHNERDDDAKLIAAAPDMLKEIDKLREDKQTCVLMLRALYAWLDGIGDGAPDASPMQKEALWRCATITETLEKVGEL